MGTLVGLDRDRAFYTTIMLVIAVLYILFAAMGGSTRALLLETALATAFIVVTIIGFKYSLWLVAGALAAHGIQDVFHGGVIANAGVPVWWPPFCSAYDVVAAGYLAFLLRTRKALGQGSP